MNKNKLYNVIFDYTDKHGVDHKKTSLKVLAENIIDAINDATTFITKCEGSNVVVTSASMVCDYVVTRII